MTVFGNRVFVDKTKLRQGHWAALEPNMTGTPTRRGKCLVKTEMHRRMTCDNRRAPTGTVSTGTTATARSCRGPGRLLPGASEGARSCWLLDFELPASRTVKAYISIASHHPVCGTRSQQPWGKGPDGASVLFRDDSDHQDYIKSGRLKGVAPGEWTPGKREATRSYFFIKCLPYSLAFNHIHVLLWS